MPDNAVAIAKIRPGTSQIAEGETYKVIKRAISILITDYVIFNSSERYHHRFRLYDAEARLQFSNTIEINTLELPKLPQSGDGTELGRWLQFLRADDEEALEMLAQNNPTIGKAVGVLRRISADEETRILIENREKARRDHAALMEWAMDEGLAKGKTEGIAEGLAKGKAEGVAEGLAKGKAEGLAKGIAKGVLNVARKLLDMEMPIDDVVNATGLTYEEVERVKFARE